MRALEVINKDSKVLDLCTGSGAIGITVKLKSNATVTVSDISDKAIDVCSKNAKDLGAEINVIKSDLFTDIKGEFDVVISNPPYIKSSDIKGLDLDVLKEPILALDGGLDGLDFYRKIADNCYNYLTSGGYLFLECGYDQANDIKNIFETYNNYSEIEIIKDINGVDRILKIKRV